MKKWKVNEERKNVPLVEVGWRNVQARTHEVWSNSCYGMPSLEQVVRAKEAEKAYAVSSHTQLPSNYS